MFCFFFNNNNKKAVCVLFLFEDCTWADRGDFCISKERFWRGFSAKFLLCLLGQTTSPSNPRRAPVGIVGQVWMLLHCQASPEGLVPAAPKVGQDLLTRPSLTWKEQLATPGVSSPEGNGNLKGHPSLTGCVQEGVTPQAARGQKTPPHLPVTQLRCLASYHISGAAV